MRDYLFPQDFHSEGVVAAGLFAAAVGYEGGLCQGGDVALEGLGGDAQFGIELGDRDAGMGADVVEDFLLGGIQS